MKPTNKQIHEILKQRQINQPTNQMHKQTNKQTTPNRTTMTITTTTTTATKLTTAKKSHLTTTQTAPVYHLLLDGLHFLLGISIFSHHSTLTGSEKKMYQMTDVGKTYSEYTVQITADTKRKKFPSYNKTTVWIRNSWDSQTKRETHDKLTKLALLSNEEYLPVN